MKTATPWQVRQTPKKKPDEQEKSIKTKKKPEGIHPKTHINTIILAEPKYSVVKPASEKTQKDSNKYSYMIRTDFTNVLFDKN